MTPPEECEFIGGPADGGVSTVFIRGDGLPADEVHLRDFRVPGRLVRYSREGDARVGKVWRYQFTGHVVDGT